MRLHLTEAALADLDDILAYKSDKYPSLTDSVERRIRAVIQRIREWPESGRPVEEWPGARVVPVLRYPFRIFYRIEQDRVEILHIYHAAREL